MFPVIILAGGLATRLRPITEKIPKALVEVGGEPFIVHQLRLLHAHGIRNVVISAWYRGEMIRDFVGDGKRFDMNVAYVFDGDAPLGTGGAIRQALSLWMDLFLYSMVIFYLPCDYAAIQSFFVSYFQPGLMTVYPNQGKWDASNVEMENDQIICYDKKNRTSRMKFIDYGLGVFHPDVFASHLQVKPLILQKSIKTWYKNVAYWPIRQVSVSTKSVLLTACVSWMNYLPAPPTNS